MKFTVPILLSLVSTSLAAFEARDLNDSCNANNCLRAVGGTRKGATFQAQATSDCGAFLASTITPSAVTVTITGVPAGPLSPRDTASASIPTYATAQCFNDATLYSSACSCIGITATTTTLAPVTVTITVPPSATTSGCVGANLLTDPNNCGSCGNVCTGTNPSCINGACVNTACTVTSCNNFNACGDGSQSCFCFSDPNGVGFCGENASCAGLQDCNLDSDCPESDVCAFSTCCKATGVCLGASCTNPSKKLIRAAVQFARGTLYEDTAAVLGRR